MNLARSTEPSLTDHARRRAKERSIPPSIIYALLDFGDRSGFVVKLTAGIHAGNRVG
jgi:hypothetical protein